MKAKVIISVALFAVSFITGKMAEKLMPFKELMAMLFKVPANA